MKQHKAIFHIDEISKWKLTLLNVNNLINAIDNNNYKIEVLANSEAVKYYDISQKLDTNVKVIKRLQEKGVKFAACNNSILANKIETSNLIEDVIVVPAGVLELVEKQSDGYAYIKP